MPENNTRPLCSLRYKTSSNYNDNLALLVDLIKSAPENAIIVAPEVCLTNFDYERFDLAADFAKVALDTLLKIVQDQVLILTVIERRDDGIYNVAKVIHKGQMLHEQAKSRLFKFGGEHEYFAEGSDSEIVMFHVDNIRMGILICFELRFKTLWQKLEGCDVIAVPAQWGKLRSANFVTLTQALAVMNQCYVVASDTANDDTSGQSGIISPFGIDTRNGNEPCLKLPYDHKEVRKMRRYLDVGIAQ